MSKKKVLLRGVFINRDTNGEGVLKVGTTLIRVSTVMGILYKLNDVTVKFKEHLVLDKVCMEFESGKIYGIIGRNGSGKQCCLNVFAD